jgi:F-type H+-transporting ATPase subunit a
MTDYWANLPSGLQASLVITLVMMVVLVIVGARVSRLKTHEVPTGFTLIMVNLVEMVNNNQRDFFKKHWRKFTPLLFTILLFLSLANTASLFGLTAPLSNMAVAIGFSLFAFLSIQLSALWIKKPKQRAKDLMDPHPAFLPINLIGEVSTPFAMGLRLFGNLISGSVIAIFIYYIVGWLGIFIGPFLHAIFDIFFGVVQAYVYYMLLSIFISGAVED